MTKRQEPAEQLLDVFVYAPLGLAMEAAELLPRLADKGRQRVGGKVTVARMVGELAVRQGQRRAGRFVERMREQQRGPDSTRRAPSGPPGAGDGRRTSPVSRPAPDAGPSASTGSPSASRPFDEPAGVDVAGLAIPGYDTLSASQVVPRLEGLSTEEMEAIRRYEESHRARKTVLTRIDQLGNAAG